MKPIPLELEPARFAHTGGGVGFHHMRIEFGADDYQPIDAPTFIPRGSIKVQKLSTEKPIWYAATSELRAGWL